MPKKKSVENYLIEILDLLLLMIEIYPDRHDLFGHQFMI